MAKFRVATHKLLAANAGYKWTNVYHVDAIGLADALSKGGSIAAAEKDLYTADTVIFEVTATPVVPGTGGALAVTETGTRTGAYADLLPLFNVARVSFTDTVKKPDQKYYRAALLEADISSQVIGSDTLIAIGAVATAIQGVLGVESSNGVAYTGHTVHRAVAMRQVGWNRRTRPGMKRGWVPR